MKIIYLKEVDSTQAYLKKLILSKSINDEVAVISDIQTKGIGSRKNTWEGFYGNLFLSFSLKLDSLPNDLKLESSSIYFSFLLKEIFSFYGSNVWLKWPNDFYIDDKKIGGMITNIVGDFLICGVGINLKYAPNGFKTLDIEIDKKDLVKKYIEIIEKRILWKQVFSKYKLEFQCNDSFFTHYKNSKISLGQSQLNTDGSLTINGERIYSLR